MDKKINIRPSFIIWGRKLQVVWLDKTETNFLLVDFIKKHVYLDAFFHKYWPTTVYEYLSNLEHEFLFIVLGFNQAPFEFLI